MRRGLTIMSIMIITFPIVHYQTDLDPGGQSTFPPLLTEALPISGKS